VKDWDLAGNSLQSWDWCKMVDQKSVPMVPQYMQQNKT
jgi:hypothetical protein